MLETVRQFWRRFFIGHTVGQLFISHLFVSFFTSNSLNIFGTSKDNDTTVFQDVVNWGPIFTGRFHTDVPAMTVKQPL